MAAGSNGNGHRAQLTIRYDFRSDVLTVGGARYAGEMFRLFGHLPVGSVLELVARDDGVLTLRSVEPAVQDIAAVALPLPAATTITVTVEQSDVEPDPSPVR